MEFLVIVVGFLIISMPQSPICVADVYHKDKVRILDPRTFIQPRVASAVWRLKM